ncbi:MAG: CUAEP/CCAEP-tail radical SAM (seleno)protein [Bryobacteraceae bacterium]
MRILLLSTYDLGHQPFGLSSPAAWLRERGHEVTCSDLSVDAFPARYASDADLICFYLPMHTATRLAVPVISKAKRLNPGARICCYGLYAPLNEPYLRELGVHAVLGGEFESALCDYADNLTTAAVSLERLKFRVPDRSTLAPLASYAKLRVNGETKLAGYTEASRGCKHLCRHCPIVPVYQGTFRVVQRDVVLEDIRRLAAAGAEHITFGDPDFFNGPAHAMRIVRDMHCEHPHLSYDATIKIEHLRGQRTLLPELKNTGCLFVTSAVESFDDEVLIKLNKGHTRADFLEVVRDFRELDLSLSPTFIPFTPWTTLESYREFLSTLAGLDLIESVGPVQLALRLLIPAGSLLLELNEIQAVLNGFEAPALLHRWKHSDPEMDALAGQVLRTAATSGSRREVFARIWELAHSQPLPENFDLLPRAAIPYLDEPWYC